MGPDVDEQVNCWTDPWADPQVFDSTVIIEKNKSQIGCKDPGWSEKTKNKKTKVWFAF